MAIKVLYLCEKPDQATKVAKELGPVGRKDGWVECRDGVAVTWARGHLLQPKMPEDYDEDLKKWQWDTLPIIPGRFQFKARDQASARMLRGIGNLLKQARTVVVATDPDREGELIAYEIITHFGYKGPVKRLWLQDLTPAAIRKAIESLRPGKETMPLYFAALARTCADWIVGMNMSRAATLKLRRGGGKPLSIGRVQTPTLALICRLERKIRDFKPQDYYELLADVDTVGGHSLRMRFRPAGERKITEREKIEQIRARASGASGPIAVTEEDKAQAPHDLLDLNALQQEANARFGWSAEKALQVAQSLYDGTNGAGQALLTYPRTDCSVLPEEHIGRIPAVAGNLVRLPAFASLAPALAKPVVRRTVYNDEKVTAHTAIVPTAEFPNVNRLSADERKLYEMVARFYLAAHLPDYRYRATRLELDANGVPFVATGTTPVAPGWRVAFGTDSGEPEDERKDEDDAGVLPPVKDGEAGRVREVRVDAKRTKPPARFTEKTLLRAMKNIAAYVEDDAAKRRLKQTSGIGTPATRAGIIETLKEREFVVVEKRKLVPTETGMALIEALEAAAPDYADPAITAQWEDGLEAIAESKLSTSDFVAAVIDKTRKDVRLLRDREDLKLIGVEDGHERKGPFIPREQREAILQGGVEVYVPFGMNDKARELGFVFSKERGCWMAPEDCDRRALIEMGWLNADGTRPQPPRREGVSGARREEILKTGIAVTVPYGHNDEAKGMGAVFCPERKTWVLPADADRDKLVAMGWLNADGSRPMPKRRQDGVGAGASGGGGSNGGEGVRLNVPFDRRNDAKALGARWVGEKRAWFAPAGADLDKFRQAGFLD